MRRIWLDASEIGTTVVKAADTVAGECDMRPTFDEAPHLLEAGTSMASAFNGEVQVGLLLPDNLIPPHALDLFPRYSMLFLVTSDTRRRYGARSRHRGSLRMANRGLDHCVWITVRPRGSLCLRHRGQ